MILLMLLLTLRLLLMDWSWLGLHVTWLVGERCTQLKHPPPTPSNWLSRKYEYCANIDMDMHIALKQKYEFEFLSRAVHSWKTRMLTIKALWGSWTVGDIMKAGAGNDDEGDPGKLIWSIVAVRPPSHTKFHYPRKEGRGQRGQDGYLAQSE